MFIDIAAEQKGRVLQQRAYTIASRNRSGACTYMKKRCSCTCITIMPKFLDLVTHMYTSLIPLRVHVGTVVPIVYIMVLWGGVL